MFFCVFWEIFKSTFFTEPLRVTTSGSSGRYLKAYQNEINSGNNSDFNANTERIFVICDNFGSRHHKIFEIFKRMVCGGVLYSIKL